MNPKIELLIAKARAAQEAKLAKLAASGEAHGKPKVTQTTTTQTPDAIQNNSLPQSPILTKIAAASSALCNAVSGIILNAEQQLAIEMGLRGQSFCLIGAAGTGKTTVTQELIKLIQQASHMRVFTDSTKHLNKDTPALVIGGYTNKAVNNIRKKLSDVLQTHCMTLHKLIEFGPEYFEIMDAEGNSRITMRFTPSRNGANPLPHLSTIIFEESSMIGTDLYSQVLDALPRSSATQMIFLGDIFQLPPVFGPSILGFKMSELPVVELTHVYRQALESPIISLATAVRTDTFNQWITDSIRACTTASSSPATNKLTSQVTVDNGEHGKVTIRPWKKRIANTSALHTIANMMTGLIATGDYSPEEDQILCPFNKAFGTIELNKHISDYLAKQRQAIVYEVIARYQRSYWAVGDRVLVDRHDAVITKIESTVGYSGKPPVAASTTLDRWGNDSTDTTPKEQRSVDDILNELDAIAEADDAGKNLASHTITVYIPDLDIERKLDNAGDINGMLMSYALTVHKSQGSEWRKVFILLHHTHQTMCSRELLYTAITRAKQELYIVCEGDIGGYKNQLLSGSNRAVIPGTTLKDKIEYFKSKAQSYRDSE